MRIKENNIEFDEYFSKKISEFNFTICIRTLITYNEYYIEGIVTEEIDLSGYSVDIELSGSTHDSQNWLDEHYDDVEKIVLEKYNKQLNY